MATALTQKHLSSSNVVLTWQEGVAALRLSGQEVSERALPQTTSARLQAAS